MKSHQVIHNLYWPLTCQQVSGTSCAWYKKYKHISQCWWVCVGKRLYRRDLSENLKYLTRYFTIQNSFYSNKYTSLFFGSRTDAWAYLFPTKNTRCKVSSDTQVSLTQCLFYARCCYWSMSNNPINPSAAYYSLSVTSKE